MSDEHAEQPMCPRCGAYVDPTVAYGRYSTFCPACKKVTLENEFLTYAALEKPSEPPDGCRVGLSPDLAGAAVFHVPRIGITGVHYAPLIYTVLWTFTLVCAVVSAYKLGGLFILPAVFLCLPTLSIVVGAAGSLLETQEIDVSGDEITVTKRGIFSLRATAAIGDIELISVHGAPPLNPLNPGRFLLHTPETANEFGLVPVPTIKLTHKVICFGEFLSDAEKTWLVRELKSIVLRKTGRRV